MLLRQHLVSPPFPLNPGLPGITSPSLLTVNMIWEFQSAPPLGKVAMGVVAIFPACSFPFCNSSCECGQTSLKLYLREFIVVVFLFMLHWVLPTAQRVCFLWRRALDLYLHRINQDLFPAPPPNGFVNSLEFPMVSALAMHLDGGDTALSPYFLSLSVLSTKQQLLALMDL